MEPLILIANKRNTLQFLISKFFVLSIGKWEKKKKDAVVIGLGQNHTEL